VSASRPIAALALLGGALAACLTGMAASVSLQLAPWRFVFLYLAALGFWGAASRLTFGSRGPARARLGVILGGALLLRLILLPMPPSLSTDLFRYLWDGMVQQAGINPYRFPPAAPELNALRDGTIFPALNHPDWVTIYPPGAQLLFFAMAGLAPGSVLAVKGLFLLLDLVSCGLIALLLRRFQMDPARVILYAWHPLVVVELAGSGHLDAAVIPLIVGALLLARQGRSTAAGLLLGLGGAVKLYPLLLLPAVGSRRHWRPVLAATLVVSAAYLVYLPGPASPLGSLPRYVREEWFNPGVRLWLEGGIGVLGVDPGGVVRWGALAAMGLVGLGVWLAGPSLPLERRALWMVGAYVLLAPNLFPWYVVPIIPVMCLTPSWPWLWLSGTVALSYLFFAQTPWQVPLWVTGVEFIPLSAGLVMLGWRWRAAPRGLRQAPAWRKQA